MFTLTTTTGATANCSTFPGALIEAHKLLNVAAMANIEIGIIISQAHH